MTLPQRGHFWSCPHTHLCRSIANCCTSPVPMNAVSLRGRNKTCFLVSAPSWRGCVRRIDPKSGNKLSYQPRIARQPPPSEDRSLPPVQDTFIGEWRDIMMSGKVRPGHKVNSLNRKVLQRGLGPRQRRHVSPRRSRISLPLSPTASRK